MRWGITSLLSLLLAACTAPQSSTRAPVDVFAASSLAGVFEELASDARINAGGSGELAAQIREGAPADVFATASPRYTGELFEAGLVEEPIDIATNVMVVVVPADNPAGIHEIVDLGREGVTVVLADEGVPAGDYAREILDALDRGEVLENVVSEEQDVLSVVGKVALGEADAGFVYRTDAIAAGDELEVIEIPLSVQPEIRYAIAIVSGTDDPGAARAFVDLVTGETGRAALMDAGFGAP